MNNIIPEHIAIIMDGNGRWAKNRGLMRTAGHNEGAENFRKTVEYCAKKGVKYLTVYAFSTENWKRPESEVSTIMGLLEKYLKKYAYSVKKENIGLYFFGDKSRFSPNFVKMMEDAERASQDVTSMKVGVCLNYGGRDEIVSAVKKAVLDVEEGKISAEDITEDYIQSKLYTALFPNPDLIIRSGGEMRISNFLLWQAAYSELYFSDVLWPDFSEKEMDKAIEWFCSRNRRFGGV